MPTNKTETLDDARCCNKCGTVAEIIEETSEEAHEPRECFKITCSGYDHGAGLPCKAAWCYCTTCKKRFGINNIVGHHRGKKHKTKHELRYPPPTNQSTIDTTNETTAATNATNDAMDFDSFPVDTTDNMSFADVPPEEFCAQMDEELKATSHGTASLEKVNGPPLAENTVSMFPRVNDQGNEWLEKAFKDRPRATLADLHECFSFPEVKGMKEFWIAELGSGRKRCGGGLCYLVGMAFQQASLERLNDRSLPGFSESMWHFEAMVQYHSMTERQRKRQCRLHDALQLHEGLLFEKTFLPMYSQLSRIYGTTSSHSICYKLTLL